MGKRGPETERSPVGATVIVLTGAPHCEATRSACRCSDRAWHERRPERWRRRGVDGPAASTLAGVGVSTGDRGGPSLALRTEFLTVGEAHQVAVPRSLEVQAPEPDFEPSGEGVQAAHGVTRTAVLSANHHGGS
jgi:hypothetical protein